MTIDVPTSEPTSLRAGDTLAWRKTLDEYSAADGWVLSYRLLSASGKTDIATTADGAVHVVSVAAATTAALAAGDYTLVGSVAKAAERYTVYQGAVKVLADLAASTSHDGRSAARQALDALRATYYAWLEAGGGGRKTVTVGGRSTTFESPGEILERINALEIEVARERAFEAAANHGNTPGRVFVRM